MFINCNCKNQKAISIAITITTASKRVVHHCIIFSYTQQEDHYNGILVSVWDGWAWLDRVKEKHLKIIVHASAEWLKDHWHTSLSNEDLTTAQKKQLFAGKRQIIWKSESSICATNSLHIHGYLMVDERCSRKIMSRNIFPHSHPICWTVARQFWSWGDCDSIEDLSNKVSEIYFIFRIVFTKLNVARLTRQGSLHNLDLDYEG
jgi:hypothetical protein